MKGEMDMQAPLKKKSDMKLFILYLMDKIGYPLDFSSLNDICSVDGIISGFDFAECFSELLDAENICEVKQPEGDAYVLSERGQKIVEALSDMLIPSLRENALKSAMKLLSFRKSGQRITQAVETDPKDGTKRLICSVINNDGVRFSLTLAVDSQSVLDKMQYNFNRRPEEMYKAIYALMAGDADFI